MIVVVSLLFPAHPSSSNQGLYFFSLHRTDLKSNLWEQWLSQPSVNNADKCVDGLRSLRPGESACRLENSTWRWLRLREKCPDTEIWIQSQEITLFSWEGQFPNTILIHLQFSSSGCWCIKSLKKSVYAFNKSLVHSKLIWLSKVIEFHSLGHKYH